jgi:hypothetical protein
MQNLTKLEETVLLDQLAEQTAVFNRLLLEKNREEEYSRVKLLIKRLIAEIESRKVDGKNNWPGTLLIVDQHVE